MAFDKFELMKKYRFRSIELLLNLNSFGFLREGCRLLKYKDFDDACEGLEERESTEDTRQTNDIANMDRVANGNYWQQIVADYNNGKIDAFDAEERFVKEYCKQLDTIFAVTINIPIKARKLKNMPKYRMVFATNHRHGLIEMADNMMRRWKQMQDAERNGQIMLFEMNTNFCGGLLNFDYKQIVLDALSDDYVKFDDYICYLILKYGVLCEIGKIKNIVKEMEAAGQIEIVRTPALTDTGRPAKWID
ncbi:MAG: hypothetical protein M1130_10745 [Actinobacteria bacterium]|nr:hypothetical protein [Actinomycetota bacterium]